MESDTQEKVENQEKGIQNHVTIQRHMVIDNSIPFMFVLPRMSLTIELGATIWEHVSTGQTLKNPNDYRMNLIFNKDTDLFELQPAGIADGDSSYWH